MARWCSSLVAAAAALVLLAAPLQPAAADRPGPIPPSAPGGTVPRSERPVHSDAADVALPAALSRRLTPQNVSGTYSLFADQDPKMFGCPTTLTLGDSKPRSGVSPTWLLDFPGESITEDGARCAGGNLVVIRSMVVGAPSELIRKMLAGAEKAVTKAVPQPFSRLPISKAEWAGLLTATLLASKK